jgi:nucleoside-diphosphate-sugar epimerase
MKNSQKVAVVGASGVVGRALVEHLMQGEIPVVGLSRRPPADLADAPFQPLDLTANR